MQENAPYCYLQLCTNTEKRHLFVIIRVAPGFTIVDTPNVIAEGTGFRVVINIKAAQNAPGNDWHSAPLLLESNTMDLQSGIVLTRTVKDNNQELFSTKVMLTDADATEECVSSAPAYCAPHVRLLYANDDRKPRCVIPVRRDGQNLPTVTETISLSRSSRNDEDNVLSSNIVIDNHPNTGSLYLYVPGLTNQYSYEDKKPDDGHFQVQVTRNGTMRKGKVRSSNSTIQPGHRQ